MELLEQTVINKHLQTAHVRLIHATEKALASTSVPLNFSACVQPVMEALSAKEQLAHVHAKMEEHVSLLPAELEYLLTSAIVQRTSVVICVSLLKVHFSHVKM